MMREGKKATVGWIELSFHTHSLEYLDEYPTRGRMLGEKIGKIVHHYHTLGLETLLTLNSSLGVYSCVSFFL